MGLPAAKLGSTLDHGGAINSSLITNVKVNGINIAVIGDSVSDHNPGTLHNGVVINSGSSKVFAGGIGVARQNDTASCGGIITGNLSTKVLVG